MQVPGGSAAPTSDEAPKIESQESRVQWSSLTNLWNRLEAVILSVCTLRTRKDA